MTKYIVSLLALASCCVSPETLRPDELTLTYGLGETTLDGNIDRLALDAGADQWWASVGLTYYLGADPPRPALRTAQIGSMTAAPSEPVVTPPPVEGSADEGGDPLWSSVLATLLALVGGVGVYWNRDSIAGAIRRAREREPVK